MCGIFGAFAKNDIDIPGLQKATDTLIHRGPDFGGYYEDAETHQVFLGHRRLSIIDVSAHANQPLYSSNKRYVIVYNGEVYNFKELKNKLPNFNWQTSGDTEVVLELFVQYGTESFAWLNGIFAFAIYDTVTKKIYLCRDPLGIKPLFIQREKGRLLFASELKAILAGQYSIGLKSKNLTISKTAVAHFLHLGYIPEPYCVYKGIKKFPAANFGIYDTKTQEWAREKYWDVKDFYLQNRQIDESTALKAYKEKLYGAVERQMLSDVPLGTFLSGGIDSSLVTAVASKISNTKIKTFSIGFENAQHDESIFAENVAKHLNTEHHLFKLKTDDLLDLVPEFLHTYDEPFADSSAFPTMLVSKMAAQHVKVTLSGDGGDEFFQGYGMYQWAERLNDPKLILLRKPYVWLSQFLNQRHQRAALVFDYPKSTHKQSHIFSQEQYLFSEQELKKLLRKNKFDFDGINKHKHKGSPRERQALWDIENYLKDDLLVKVDRASMRYSLETRVPLLDKEIVEFAIGLPLHLKLSDTLGTKHLMKQTLYELVPQSLFDRPKQGFSIPLKQWLKKELRPMIEKYMTKPKIEIAGIIEYAEYTKLAKDFYGGKDYLYNRLWAMFVLHWWYYECRKP